MGSPHNTCGPILVVDSDLRSRAFVAKLLLRAGYSTLPATTATEAMEFAQTRRPCLVLIEVALPGVSGFELCCELRSEIGETLPIMFLSRRGVDPLERVAGLLLGADDYLAKPVIPAELLARVRALTRRSEPIPPKRNFNLTSRELEVLWLLAEGLGQADIANQLVVSPKTVGNHIEHILGKLGVHSRAQAVARAYREHIWSGA